VCVNGYVNMYFHLTLLCQSTITQMAKKGILWHFNAQLSYYMHFRYIRVLFFYTVVGQYNNVQWCFPDFAKKILVSHGKLKWVEMEK